MSSLSYFTTLKLDFNVKFMFFGTSNAVSADDDVSFFAGVAVAGSLLIN